ncbi:MAG: hypothetical protein LBS85_05000 [Clostridiales Family XIII bacterium]|nr:hypothetical protein [Clostridiales Family XIII bacterium]
MITRENFYPEGYTITEKARDVMVGGKSYIYETTIEPKRGIFIFIKEFRYCGWALEDFSKEHWHAGSAEFGFEPVFWTAAQNDWELDGRAYSSWAAIAYKGRLSVSVSISAATDDEIWDQEPPSLGISLFNTQIGKVPELPDLVDEKTFWAAFYAQWSLTLAIVVFLGLLIAYFLSIVSDRGSREAVNPIRKAIFKRLTNYSNDTKGMTQRGRPFCV